MSTLSEREYELRPENPFGESFEEGAEGAPPTVRPDSLNGARGSTNRFNGVIVVDDKVVLKAGGLQAEVLASDDYPADRQSLTRERSRSIALFHSYNGQSVYLQGEQRNGYILRAGIASQTTRATSRFDETTRSQFKELNNVITAYREDILAHPDVLSVRPGYRFKEGWITDEPVLVATVKRKLDRSAMPEDRLVSHLFKGVPVDVRPATPVEQLKYEKRNEAGSLAERAGLSRIEPSSAFPEFESWQDGGFAEAGEGITEALSDINYQPPPNLELAEVTGSMTVTCHVSPDAGWPTLSEFLDRTNDRLTIAIYDFTAPHVLKGMRSAMSHADGELHIIFGPHEALPKAGDSNSNKADDLPESTIISRLSKSLKGRFKQVWAVVSGPNKIFANSYHIKVIVRDGDAIWLSSGNLQSSNQPDLDPLGADANIPNILKDYNREWNVIVEHKGLAELFEKFIEWDIKNARQLGPAPEVTEMPDLFVPESFQIEAEEEAGFVPKYHPPARLHFTPNKPLRVQPLLTPDNYAERVLPFIQSAKQKIYFQNQSITFAKTNFNMFTALVDTLRDKHEAGVDVRIILRGDFGARDMLEALKARGFDSSIIKFQGGCHNKGIVVDSEAVLVSSHNWTNSGTLFNRDAGLIFYDPRIARYYEDIFLYDWNNLAARQVSTEAVMPVLAVEGPPPPGMVRMRWEDYYEN